MNIIEILKDAQGGNALANIGRVYGLTERQTTAAIDAVLPELSRALERNMLSRGGIADVVKALGDGHHSQYLDRPELIGTPAMIADGNDILGHILGSRDASRAVADRAADTSGIGAGILRQLLPIIASILMGALSRQSQGGLGDILKRLPGGTGGGFPFPGGGQDRGDSGNDGDLGDILRRVPGLPGSREAGAPQSGQRTSPAPSGGGPLQLPGGIELPGGLGDVLGKIPGMGGPQSQPMPQPRQSAGGSPLPLPGERIPGINAPATRGPNPYEDLSDVIRRGAAPASPSAGPLGNIVRDLIGGILGFQSKGIFGWILRLIVYRWGWGLVRRILGRVFMGR